MTRIVPLLGGFCSGMNGTKLTFMRFLFVLVLLTGSSSASSQQAAQETLLPLENLRVETKAGSFTFVVEVADTEGERATGLMFREQMAANHGMLFDFGKLEPIAMWMRNTPLPLDMIFIQPDGTVLRIAKDTVPFSTDIITSGGPVSHVLEVNAGIANQIGLEAGDKVIHDRFKSAN